MPNWVPDWVEEMFEPIRRKAREANAPLLEKLDVTEADLERLASIRVERPDLVSPGLRRAVAITALRGATRF
jgi:hypothetical protein